MIGGSRKNQKQGALEGRVCCSARRSRPRKALAGSILLEGLDLAGGKKVQTENGGEMKRPSAFPSVLGGGQEPDNTNAIVLAQRLWLSLSEVQGQEQNFSIGTRSVLPS